MKGLARLVLLACLGAGIADASERLNIGVLVETGFDLNGERWEGLVEHLGQSMADRDIEVEVYGFDALEQAIQRRAVDLVITNGSHYISMSRRVGLSAPIASIIPVFDEKPLPGVGGTVLVDARRQDLGTLEDLRGKTVATATRNSLAYHAAAFETIRNRPETRIGYRLIETGLPHEQAVRAMLAGDADAAFVRAGVLEAMVREGSLEEGATRVLNLIDLETYPFRLSTALYPDRLVTAMPQLDKSIAERVTASLLQLPKGGDFARSMGIHGFTLPYSHEPVANMARALRLPPYANPAPVSLRDIWRDHRQWLISLSAAIIMIIGLVFFLVGYAARLRESRAQTRERIKEQSCLYDIFKITEDIEQPLDDMITRVVDLLPSALQHHEVAGARIIWQDRPFQTGGFSTLGPVMSAPLATAEGQPGRIDISYSESRPDADEGPFLAEERALLEAISSRISTVLKRRLLEDTAREREQIYRTIFSLAADAITLVDCDTLEFIEFNETACRQLGYSRDEFSRLRLPDIQGDFDESTIRRMIEEVRHIGETHFDARRKCKDGKYLTVLLGLSFLEFRGRSCMSLIWTDVTEQREAEKRLRESEHRFRRLFRDVHQPVLLIKDGQFVDINRAALDLMHIDDSAMFTGLSPSDISPPYQPDGELSADKATRMIEIARRQGPHRFEWEHQRPDGTCFTADVLITPIEIAGDRFEHIIWTDISARKQAEAALYEKESQFRLAIESSLDGFWALDTHGRIVEVNETYCRLSGYSREELLTMSIKDIEHDNDERTQSHIDLIIERGNNLFETTHRAKGGRLWPVEVAASFNPDAGGRLYSFLRDISQRKMAAQQIERYRLHLEDLVRERTGELEQARSKAEIANRSKSTFLANMSHEIRTPLNAVLGLAHLLRSGVSEPEQRERVEKIIVSAKHLLGLINDILDLSKIEADRIVLDETCFNVLTTLDHACSMVRDRMADKGLQFHTDFDSAIATTPVIGDALRLNQILVNLLSNASKFTERGSVNLRARLIELSDDTALLRFEIEDTGVGISEEIQPRLFQPFEQGDSGISRKFGGTGLGLAISQRLTTLMGGEIGFSSVPRQGSLFWFTVRLMRGTQTEAKTAESAPKRGVRRGARILLVEDNPINQEVTREVLEATGLVVNIANNGAESLDMIQRHHYDLVLMDMQMPVMGGIEATRRLRESESESDGKLPVIAMTANAFEEDRRACFDAGMNDFIVKPVDPDALYARLSLWIPETNGESGHESASLRLDPSRARGGEPECLVLDPQTGMKYFRGRRSSYERMLRRFTELHADDSAKTSESLSMGDRETAERLAHSLKGIAATLGAAQLNRQAQSLEQRIREGEPVMDLQIALQELRECIDRTLFEIESFLAE